MRVIAERRENLGKENAKKIRRQGFIPAVIYGNGKVYEHIKVKLSDMMKILKEGKTEFEISVGEKVYKVRLKDVQINPITDEPIHFDFYCKEEN
jgi:large subunit ribosomal protein L25